MNPVGARVGQAAGMPEGDSLRRAARLWAPVLEGQVLEEVWFAKLRGHRPRVGQRVESVGAVGKHLRVDLDQNLTLDIHLGMAGRVGVVAPGRPLRRTPSLRVVLRTSSGTAFCHAAPTIQTVVRGGATDDPVASLGPDLSDDHPDLDEVLARSRRRPPDTLLADLLLDQQVAAGVGNVFKSEVLFVVGLNPFRAVGGCSDDDLRRLWSEAHRQLRRNRSTPARSTTPAGDAGRTFVYRRARAGCRCCDGPISFAPAGTATSRSTYWCPRCQPDPGP